MPLAIRSVNRRVGSTAGFDADAAAYIRAVQSADGAALEPAVARAINAFVLGCKADGIWDAMKSCCILMGARTLTGALTALKGTAPTNTNFVSGDYNRETGLVGNGSTKHLNSNRNNNADPQDSFHMAVYVTTFPTGDTALIGVGANTTGASHITTSASSGGILAFRNRTSTGSSDSSVGSPTGLVAHSRAASGSYTSRRSGANTTRSVSSQTPQNADILVYARNNPTPNAYSNARMAFYSIGESLTLADLDTRVTDLYNAIAAAIP